MNSKPLKKDSATCGICGVIIEADEASMMTHLIYYHPVELLQSKAMQPILRQASEAISDLFESIGRRLRG